MAGTEMKNVVLIALVVVLVLFAIYQYDSTLFGLLGSYEGFQDKVTNANGATPSGNAHGSAPAGVNASPGKPQMEQNKNAGGVNQGAKNAGMSANSPATMATPFVTEKPLGGAPKEGFADLSAYEGPANFGAAEAPAGCYPRDQLTPSELLPKDMNSIWAEQNPMGPGSLKGKNFLSAGALIGVNTVGQSLRNANLQIRSEPPNPQVPVSIFNQSTISPDISHRPLEIGA
jgi:hypothetical protein